MKAARAGLALAGLAISAASALDPPPPYFDDAAIDAAGRVWALSRAEYNQLFSFDGTRWTPAPVAFASGERAMPAGLGRWHDGAVACVWRLSDDTMAVSRHSGEESRIVARGKYPVPGSGLEVRPFCDSRGGLWITGRSPNVARVDASGEIKYLGRLSDSDLVKPLRNYNPIMAIEDGRGRVWLWSHTKAGGSNQASINGVVICAGDSAETKVLPGLDGKFFGPIMRRDDRHMWVAVAGDGLYEVDADSLETRRLDDPEKKAFCCVHNLFQSGGDVFLVTSHGFRGRLWRLREGEWTCLIPEVDRHPNEDRAWLMEDGALLLAAQPATWRVSRDGEAERLGWFNGLPVEGVRELARLPDGRVFALGHGGRIFCGDAAPRSAPSRIEELFVRLGWAFDRAGRVWCVEGADRDTLKEWNGREWRRHPFPAGQSDARFESLRTDEEGRVWLMPKAVNGPTIFFDARSGEWNSFESVRDAFAGTAKNPPHFIEPSGWPKNPMADRPVYQNGRIAYRSRGDRINFFVGAAWREWKQAEILPGSEAKTRLGDPAIDQGGKLAVEIGAETMQWNGEAWVRVARRDQAPKSDIIDRFQQDGMTITVAVAGGRPEISLPDGAVADSRNAVVRDNLGTYWFLQRGKLFKAVPGARVQVFRDGEPNPFQSPRLLNDVFVDPAGVAFLRTSSSAGGWFMLRPAAPPPVAKVAMRAADGAMVATIERPAGTRVSWRLDDDPWSETADSTISLDDLPAGRHVLQVRARDAELQFGPVAAAEFETAFDPNQLDKLIRRLGDPDFARRKSAVAALVRRGDEALPLLQSARSAAGDDERWWIDVAIQEIERRKKPPGG